MKKLFNYALLVLSLLAVSCEQGTDDSPLQQALIEPFDITISGNSVDNIEALISYDNSDGEYPYAVVMVNKEEFDAAKLSSYQSLFEGQMPDDVDPSKVDEKYIFSGDAEINLSEIWALEYSTEYVVAAFAYDGNRVVSNFEIAEVETAPRELIEYPTATVNTVTQTKLTVDVKMNDYEGNYYVAYATESYFVNNYNENPKAVAEYFMELETEGYGTDLSIVDNIWVFNNDATADISFAWGAMIPGSKVYVFTFGINDAGEVTSAIDTLEVEMKEFTEGPKVEVEIDALEPEDIKVNIDGGDLSPYHVIGLTTEAYARDFESDPMVVANAWIYQMVSYYTNPGEVNDYCVFSGSYDSISLAEQVTFKADTDYVIVAYGVENLYPDDPEGGCWGPSSMATVLEVSTPPYDLPSGALESISVSNVEFYNADVEVKIGSFDGYYMVASCPKSTFEKPTAAGGFNSDAELIAQGFGTTMNTYGAVLDEVSDEYLVYNSDAVASLKNAWAIEPETEYIAFAFGVLPDGTVASNVLVSNPFTTPAAPVLSNIDIEVSNIRDNTASITFTPDVVGIFYFNDVMLKSVADQMTNQEIIDDKGYVLSMFVSSDVETYDPSELHLEAGSEYTAIAFACSFDGIASEERFTKDFTTTGTYNPDIQVPESVTIPDVEFGEINAVRTTSKEIYFELLPDVAGMGYMFFTLDKETFDSFESEEELIKRDIQELKDRAASWNMRLDEAMQKYFVGYNAITAEDNVSTTWLDPDTEYVLYAYGVDPKTALPITKIATTTASTLPEEADSAPLSPNVGVAYSSLQNIDLAAANSNKSMVNRTKATTAPTAKFSAKDIVRVEKQAPIRRSTATSKESKLGERVVKAKSAIHKKVTK